MFSGIGGFEYGMQKSKYEFESVGFSEVDKYAISIYSRHFPKHKNYGDATKIDTSTLPDFELLVGGFPCQAFSIAGQRKGFEDCRGTLFFEIARVLKDKKPSYFLLENVKGLLSHNGGRTFQTILRVCNELRYDVSWKIYNSKNYGVPQSRERLFIKGYFRGKCGREILSYGRENKEVTKRKQKNTEIRNNFKKISDNKYMTTTMNGDAFALTTVGNRGMPLKKKQDNYVLELCRGSQQAHAGITNGDYCPTLTAFASSNTNVPLIKFKNEIKIRRLTPLECERLQGFPDSWTKFGRDGELISDSQRYKCLGNAVTTNVIEHIFNTWSLSI